MTIFHCVESYYPSVGGMQEVVKQLSERLAKLGHSVTVLTRKHDERDFNELNGVTVISFDIIDNPVSITTKHEQAYVDFLLNLKGDIVTFFAAQQWATDLALPYLANINAKKVSVPTGYSGLYNPRYKTYFEKMTHYIHHYDMNVYLSYDYRDINFAKQHGVSKRCVIPNGAAEDEFLKESRLDVRKELGIPSNHQLILLVGSYTGIKGHKEAVEIYLKSTIQNATLLMIGNKHEYFRRLYIKKPLFGLLVLIKKLLTRKKFIFGFYSREFTVAAYKQSNLFLFPSNIECSPIVLFECAAARLPFVCTNVGNSPEIASWTKGGVILPTTIDKNGLSRADINASVKVVNELLANAAKLKELGEVSFSKWKENYSWEHIALKYESLYKNLLHQ